MALIGNGTASLVLTTSGRDVCVRNAGSGPATSCVYNVSGNRERLVPEPQLPSVLDPGQQVKLYTDGVRVDQRAVIVTLGWRNLDGTTASTELRVG